MRLCSLLPAALGCAVLAVPAAASAATPSIVVLKDDADAPAVAADHARRHGAQVSHVYTHALRGYAAVLPDGRAEVLRRDPRVAYVEADGVANATAQTMPAGMTQINAQLSSTVSGNGSGVVTNVTSYVIDTGIASHQDLNVVGHVNFAGGKNADCNGHGTHVAGTIAARDNTVDVVGVAPGSPLVGVKVLGCSGSGSYSGVIAGVDWVAAQKPGTPKVANMSLGGPRSTALETAIKNAASGGTFFALAAGNETVDACTKSPAALGGSGGTPSDGIMTVEAADSVWGLAYFSNFGPCVDVRAPGVNVLSTRRGGGTTTMSGTSMASPHVAGAAALWRSANTGDAEGAIRTAATTGTSGAPRLNVDPF